MMVLTENIFPAAGCPLPAARCFLLAVSFVTPAFAVAGLLLIGIPIVIHILNRRRFRTVEWAAMTFLLQAMKKNRRRLRFEQWLLLAMRCLVLGLLGLALARPMGCADSSLASLAGRPAGLHVFVIDNSYSMAYEANRPDAKTHLDQAKLLAKRLIDRLSAGGESVAVITAGAPATALIASPAYDLPAVRSAIERIEQSAGGTDLSGALTHAITIARESSGQAGRYLYLLTDGTHSAFTDPQAQGLAAAAQEAAKHYRITHFNLSRPDQWNHAVLEAEPADRRLVRLRFENDFLATVRGYGNAPQVLLQWKLDDQVIGGSATIQPGLQSDPVKSSPPIREGGPHVVSVSLASDNRLKLDDTRWRVADVASELKVLIADGERGIGSVRSGGEVLYHALAPGRAAGSNAPTVSYVAPEVISDLELGNKILSDYRAVILAGVGNIQPGQADQLKRFVESGGTLIVFGGEPVNSQNYNDVLLPRGLMPGPLTKRVTAGADQSFLFDFKPDGLPHPMLRVFRGMQNSGLNTAQTFIYWQVEPSPQVKPQRVLDFLPDDKGRKDPAITLHTSGAGHVVFIATSAGPVSGGTAWTALPVKLAYPSLVHEMLSGSVGGGDAWMNVAVGQPLLVPPGVQMTSAPVLRDPMQVEVAMEQQVGEDGRSLYRSRPLSRPGLYTLLTGSRSIPVAVNVPAAEADIRPLDPAAIRKALGEIDLASEGDSLPPIEADRREGNDFGWSVMIVVLAVVGLECFLAMQFGHYRR